MGILRWVLNQYHCWLVRKVNLEMDMNRECQAKQKKRGGGCSHKPREAIGCPKPWTIVERPGIDFYPPRRKQAWWHLDLRCSRLRGQLFLLLEALHVWFFVVVVPENWSWPKQLLINTCNKWKCKDCSINWFNKFHDFGKSIWYNAFVSFIVLWTGRCMQPRVFDLISM